MINLADYAQEQIIIAPVIQGRFQYNGKDYQLYDLVSNSWCRILIRGNNCTVLESLASIEFENLNLIKIKGYVYNDQLIFFNFDEGKRKTQKEMMVPLLFNQMESFSSIECVIWENNQIFYLKPNYKDFFIYEVKRYLDNPNLKFLDLKGLTPELKFLGLCYILEQQELEKIKKEAEAEELRKTLQGRLVLSFRRVGAELLRYSTKGDRITCDWKLDSQEFNSVLDRNTFQVLEAGYCLSGDDYRHTLHSIVILAKDYINEDLIYKTRE